MSAIREVSHQQRQWVRTQWSRRGFGLWTRGEIRTRFSHQKSTGQPGGGALSQFARFCVVGTSNAVIDVGVFNAVLATFPTRATVPLLAYNTAAALGANVLKLGAILGAMVLSFFGMRGFVFLGRWLSPDLPARTGSLPSPSREDNARQDSSVVQELAPVAALKQRMEVLP